MFSIITTYHVAVNAQFTRRKRFRSSEQERGVFQQNRWLSKYRDNKVGEKKLERGRWFKGNKWVSGWSREGRGLRISRLVTWLAAAIAAAPQLFSIKTQDDTCTPTPTALCSPDMIDENQLSGHICINSNCNWYDII